MDLRSRLHATPGITVVVCLVIVLGGGYFFYHQSKATPVAGHYVNPGNYYTADEGQTWIADNWAQVPPFDRDGQTYVRVFVFLGRDGKPFVGYFEKFTDKAKAEILAQEEDRFKWAKISEIGDRGLLVKRPTDAKWVAKESNEGRAVTAVMFPDSNEPANPSIPDLNAKK